MALRSYRCGSCQYSFPLGPGFLGFKPCPPLLKCPKCQSNVEVTFTYKYTYYFNYTWKVLFFLSLISALPMAFMIKEAPIFVRLIFGIGVSLFTGIFVGFLAAYFLSLPVMIIFGIAQKILKAKSDAKKLQEG